MVVGAYRRWLFLRGFNCKALTGKTSVFWIGGHLWKVAANERWSYMEVQLNCNLLPNFQVYTTVLCVRI